MSKDKRSCSISQTGARVEIKRIYPELTLVEHNHSSIRTLGRKTFYLKKKMRKRGPYSDSPVEN